MSQRLLRLAAPVIAEPLINYFIVNHAWPVVWRSSNAAPVHKKDDEMKKDNYRPVSVLPAVSKVYEKVLYDQIYTAFNPIMSANLSGFRKGHSCCSALLKMSQDWRASLDNRETVVAVAIDLSKAFDSLCLNLLLAKLKAYGFSNDAVLMMSAYLLDRRQCVRIENMFFLNGG